MLLALSGALALCLAQPAASPGWSIGSFDPDVKWCGSSGAGDSVCRWLGHTYIDGQLLPKRRPRPLAPLTKVFTPLNSLSRLTMRNQARCTVGGGDRPSEVVSRWEGSLLRQISGDASCTSLTTGLPLETLCDPTEHCSGEIRARGTFLVNVLPPADASASLTESFRRRAKIVICAGAVRVRVGNDSTFSEASASVTGGNRFVIFIEEVRSLTRDEAITETETSISSSTNESTDLEVWGTMPGPGPCDSSFVEEQEHTVTG